MRRALLLLIAGCGSFEDPDIVIDFRVLGMTASVPEQIVDIDITKPPQAADILGQLVDSRVCVLLSDKNFERRLRWTMTLCNLHNDRCPDDDPHSVLGSGLWDDPDLAATPPELCANIPADGNLIGILFDALNGDQFHGVGGIYYGVSLVVGGEDADPTLDLYAEKQLRVQPRIPPDLQANHNPSLVELDVRLTSDGNFMVLPLVGGRCIDYANRGEAPYTVAPEQQVRLIPIEPDGAREVYVAPTINGTGRMFTESLTYQWLATAGKFTTEGSTGGPRDPFGNPAPLFTNWKAPKAKDLDGPIDVDFWVIQRDERLGEAWYQSCLRVVP